VALAWVLASPRVAYAAPAPTSPEHWAAAGFEAFDEGVKLQQRGAHEEAERKFRAAAEAYVAAFEAIERGSPDYATRRSLYAGRIAKAYRAAREAFGNPNLQRSATEWCARWSSLSDAADPGDGMTLLREECMHWPAPAPTPAPLNSGGEERTDQDPDAGEASIARPDEPTMAKPKLPRPQAVDHMRASLLLGGRITLGLGGASLAVALGSAIRQEQLYRELERAQCTKTKCPGLHMQSERSQALAISTLVVGAVLVGTGVALTVLALKRPASRMAIAPALHPQLLGLSLRGSF